MIVDFAIPVLDLVAIQDFLRSNGVLATSVVEEDPYSALRFHQLAATDGATATGFLDCNLFARVVDLAGGRVATKEHRIPAALMAFSICSGITFEPNFAVIEDKANRPGRDIGRDVALFRAADNIHPGEFADIALGRTDQLVSRLEPPLLVLDDQKLSRKIREFRAVYPHVLKIGLLQLGGGSMGDRLTAFLEWMYHDWCLSRAATHFAALCFSDSPPRGALKNLFSPDRELAIRGLQNAAWDLAHIVRWDRASRTSPETISLLCSADRTLQRIAQGLRCRPGRIQR